MKREKAYYPHGDLAYRFYYIGVNRLTTWPFRGRPRPILNGANISRIAAAGMLRTAREASKANSLYAGWSSVLLKSHDKPPMWPPMPEQVAIIVVAK